MIVLANFAHAALNALVPLPFTYTDDAGDCWKISVSTKVLQRTREATLELRNVYSANF